MINITLPNTSGYFDVDRETVSLKRGSTTSTLEQLGFCLVGSRTRGVFIKSIYPGSPVEQSGRIHVDDKLVQADDVPLLGLTPSQVVRILNSALSHSPTIQLTILHCCHPSSRLVPATVNENPSEQHGEKVVERNSTTIDTSNGNGDAKTKSKSGSISAEAEVHISETKEDDKKGDTLDVISTKTNAEVIDEDTAKCKNNDKSPQESVPTFKGRRVTFANMSMENSSDSTGDLCSICENDLVSPPENRSQKARLDRFSANYEKLAISRSQRRIFCRDNIDKIPNDELPLISFDQLVNSNQSISPVDNKQFQNADRQSKSSKESDGSQNLSWYCPVCLDGASRINRTHRRLMSTVCGHVFCSRCIEDAIANQGMCPSCRTKLRSLTEVHPIFM